MMRKPKLLWVGEATFLNTGYAVYGKELLSRLYKTNKYELAELACYCRSDDPRCQDIPWKVYGNLPMSKEEEQQYNSTPLNQFGEWRFNEVALDFKPDVVCSITDIWMCVVNPDTHIFTKDGIKNIIDININDLVLTHNGNYKSVTKIFRNNYSGKVYTIKPSNCVIPIKLTHGHTILCIERKVDQSCLPNFKEVKSKWKNVEDLKRLDIVCIPITKPKKIIDTDKDFARFCGYYAAEGCVLYNDKKLHNNIKGLQLSFNRREKEYINDVCCIIKRMCGTNQYISIKEKSANAITLRVFNQSFARKVINEIPGLSKTKYINEIYNGNDECVRQFLCGLFRGDGHYNPETKRANYVTTSKTLALQVFYMCLRLGILPCMSYNKNHMTHSDKIKTSIDVQKEYYRYIFEFQKESRESFALIYNNDINAILPTAKRICDGYAFLTIKDIKIEDVINIPTYNFEVQDDNSYVSSFALHNCEHIDRSPYRRLFNWAVMPTCDSIHQSEQAIDIYSKADCVFAYEDFGKQTLEQESGGSINVLDICPPGVAKEFKPFNRKREHKKKFGIEPDTIIIGTAMRNQRRKLYPDLIESFAKLCRNYPDDTKNVLLYLHTSYPDVGWDLPQLIRDSGIGHKILITYICKKCGFLQVKRFSDCRTFCDRCSDFSMGLPDTQRGLTTEQLAEMYNLFDLYVQYACSEGFGITVVEAAACGVPVMEVDFSAMESVVRKLGGSPIKVQRYFHEPETGFIRAYPDNDHLIQLILEFIRLPEQIRLKRGHDAFVAANKHYNWDNTAAKWMRYFDSIIIEDKWSLPPRIYTPNMNIPQVPNQEALVQWAIANVLGEPERGSSYFALRMTRDLNYGATTGGAGGMYFHEDSLSGSINRFKPFNAEIMINHLAALCNRRNYYEYLRVNYDQTEKPHFIKMAKPDEKDI